MTRRSAVVLLAAAAWTGFVWISRIVIMSGQDTSAGFKVVHFTLAGISLAFGLAVAAIGLRAWRDPRGESPGDSPRGEEPEPARRG